MAKKTFQGRRPARAAKYSISLSRADTEFVAARIDQAGLRGPSEFVQRLLHQAVGAKLPIVSDPPGQLAQSA